MDPNQLHPETLQTNPRPEVLPSNEPPNEIEETKKVSRKLFFFVSLILALLIPASIYIYGQSKKSNVAQVTIPTVTPAVSPSPNPKTYTITDTSDGKLITDSKYGFSFKFPMNFEVSDNSYGADLLLYFNAPNHGQPDMTLTINTGDSARTSGQFYQSAVDASKMNDYNYSDIETKKVDGFDFTSYYADYDLIKNRLPPVGGPASWYEAIGTASGKFYILHYVPDDQKKSVKNKSDFNQILSTFTFAPLSTSKFTEQTEPNVTTSPSGGQVACAQDAKLCPDGSYVSREGPNCEFAPCP